MDPKIDREEFDEIAEMIKDDASPVGIDAKKTHVIILHKLIAIERRLARLEGRAGEADR